MGEWAREKDRDESGGRDTVRGEKGEEEGESEMKGMGQDRETKVERGERKGDG